MTRNLRFIAMLLIGITVGSFILYQTSSFKSDLAAIEALPATFKLSGNRNSNSHGVTFIRISPAANNMRRNFHPLSASKVLEALKGFDATDCLDFGDQDLDNLSKANRIEYLGLDGTSISDRSLTNMTDKWPSLRFLDIEGCNVSQSAILILLRAKKLTFIEISNELNDEAFRDQVRKVSPNTIVMCDGQDVLDQPASAFESIPWSNWE